MKDESGLWGTTFRNYYNQKGIYDKNGRPLATMDVTGRGEKRTSYGSFGGSMLSYLTRAGLISKIVDNIVKQ